MRYSLSQGSADSVPVSSLPSSRAQCVSAIRPFFITLCFHVFTNPSSRKPFRFTSIRHTPYLPPVSLPCERAKAPFNKYLWNEHLQKCVKTKDFNYLQNEHLRKIRGEGAAVSPGTACFCRRYRLNLSNARVGSISRSARFLRDAPARYILGASLTTRFP
ncbi:MAG: hypothetical protein JWO71_476 [Candidatus Acidoferrum typicum]|nr:hypothetical protein [Candidatus Acidoferrum typicum]